MAIVAVQLVVLAGAALVAWKQVGEAKRLREEQTRPFVVIDFEVESFLIYLTVTNLGTTLARDVRFEIDPPFTSAIENPLQELKIFASGTPTLAPGKVIRTLFDSGIQRKRDEYPDVYRVVVRYSDQDRRRHFEETIELDLGVYWNLTTVDRKDAHDVHERLKDIRDVLKRWSSSTGGLLRVSPEEVREEHERRKRDRAQRAGDSDSTD